MARSRPLPALRNDEGARFTVIRCDGHGAPLVVTAARTRSRASRQAASGRPTTAKAGRPWLTWTSTRTDRPSTPRTVADGTTASLDI